MSLVEFDIADLIIEMNYQWISRTYGHIYITAIVVL